MDTSWKEWIKSGGTDFCKMCLYGTALNYITCAAKESGMDRNNLASFSGIGCAALIIGNYLDADTIHTTHGRPIAFATGAKLANPELNVIVVSGDGDLATIGTNHLIHSIRRNDDITVFCVNNFLYGLTGGQAGGTTPLGTFTNTTIHGSDTEPLDLIKLVLSCGCHHASRYAVLTKKPRIAINGIKKALNFKGFSFVELVSPCATHFCNKNGILNAGGVVQYLEDHYTTKKEAKKQKGKIVCGEFDSLSSYIEHAGG